MLAKAFDRLGYKVCFVERSYKKIFQEKKRMVGNIEIITIFGLPYLRGIFSGLFKLNDWIISKQLTKIIATKGLCWHILSSPLWAKSISKIAKKDQKIIYDVSDNHLDYTTNNIWRKNLKNYEDFAIEKANLITLTSEKLLNKLPKQAAYAILENGVDLESSLTANPILRELYKGKIVGFIGGVYQRVDLELVERCAKSYPSADFFVIGPTDQNEKLREMKQFNNFHYLGPISWEKIQDYFASLDVGIIPFVSEKKYPWLKTVDSVKVYQYAYFGYPIITTQFGNVKSLRPMVTVAKTNSEFVKCLGAALSGNEPAEIFNKRVALAKSHDWINIAEKMVREISSAQNHHIVVE